jgi:Lrp/AsnC family transcriptional regulator, regulator of ectoine-degradation genes
MTLNVRRSLDLDAFDLQILAALRANGRIAKVRLAELIGLSATPCGARVERLEKAGFIRGYFADVDVMKLAQLTRFRVTLSMRNWTSPKMKRLEAAIAKIPNIVECEAVLGDIDYMLTIVAGSISHYQQIIGSLISQFPDELNYTTYPASKMIKRETDVALLKLDNEEDTEQS